MPQKVSLYLQVECTPRMHTLWDTGLPLISPWDLCIPRDAGDTSTFRGRVYPHAFPSGTFT